MSAIPTSTGPDVVLEWRPRFPTDVVLTLGRLQQGKRDPVQQLDESGGRPRVWRTVRTDRGPATLLLESVGERLRATGWGRGAQAAVDAAPRLLGEDDDPTGFVPAHPVLVDAHHRFPGLRIARTGDVFQAVVAATLEQRVEGIESIGSWGRLVRQLGAPAPGPVPDGMRVFPEASAWLGLSSWKWREAGIDARRAATVRAAASAASGLQRLADRPLVDADRALRSIHGIGPWTAAEVRQRALGDADAVSVGDFHLAGIVGQTLAGRPFTDAELIPFLEPWRPHRYRVARLIYALGIEHLPRRAPRRAR